MKNRITLLNVSTSLLSQLVSIVSALILPRLILSTFGSELNGLTASIGQFLGYITLIEGGVTGVISANLYKPIVEKDNDQLSSILVTAKSFYQKIGFIFVLYTFIIAFIYPFVVKTNLSYFYVFLLTIVLSISLLMEYMFSITYRTLLNADKKIYVVSFTKIFITITNLILVFVVIHLWPNLLVLKIASCLLYIIQPMILGIYIKIHYSINWKMKKNNDLIKERWNGFAINLAAFIHGSTDVTILTFLGDLKTVSIYSIHSLIINKVEILVHSVVSAIEPTIGQAYAKGDQTELNQKLDLFEYVTFFIVGLVFTLTGLLITPFIMIYTKGIEDANYYQPLFASVLVIAEGLYLIRYPHVVLSYAANRFKEISLHAYIEAGINILVSILLVKYFGIIGVALGTVSGMLYRMIFQVYYTKKIIPNRKQFIFYKKFFSVIFITIIGVLGCIKVYPFSGFSIQSWLTHGFVYGIVFMFFYAILSVTMFKKEVRYLISYLKKK